MLHEIDVDRRSSEKHATQNRNKLKDNEHTEVSTGMP
jgi:hypothetical protein